MMGEIYSSCRKAIIWLGEDLDTTEAGTAGHAANNIGILCEL